MWRVYVWDREGQLVRIEGRTQKALMESFILYANQTGYIRVYPPHVRLEGHYGITDREDKWWRMDDSRDTCLPAGGDQELWWCVSWRQLAMSRVR